VVLVLFALSLAAAAWAAGAPSVETQPVRRLSLVVGKSTVLKSEEAVKRISIADPTVADFVLISPSEIYITGKAAGTTNMTLWRARGDYRVFDLDVGFDVSRLKQQLNEILPEENDLRVTATQGAITLSGRVSSAANLSQAVSLARAYVPAEDDNGGGGDTDKPKVINLVEVRGVQQVMLEVRVAEMQRSLAKRMGVNFNYLTESGKFGISQLGNLTELVAPDDSNLGLPGLIAPFATLVSPNVNAILRFSSNGTTWTGFIDALKADGLVKVLAEPTLIALSGQEANFLAGGEFPVPVPQGLGTVAIEYREFGVGLTFKPTVLSDNKINIEVAPEVSELDFSTAVQFSGFIVPGLSTRRARTVVELADGQSFAIAGLLRDTARDAMSKYPLLGDLPILGVLFRSRSFQRNETELVIIATPRLVKPLDTARQPLPTDFYRMPNDMEFYVLGMMEGQGGQPTDGLQGDLDGDFGHAMPGRP
jgi:pilus assembly protein CpaC